MAEMPVPGLATTYKITEEGQGGTAITPGAQGTLHATGIIKETGEASECLASVDQDGVGVGVRCSGSGSDYHCSPLSSIGHASATQAR